MYYRNITFIGNVTFVVHAVPGAGIATFTIFLDSEGTKPTSSTNTPK